MRKFKDGLFVILVSLLFFFKLLREIAYSIMEKEPDHNEKPVFFMYL